MNTGLTSNAYLLGINGDYTNTCIQVSDGDILGRDETVCAFVVDHQLVSRKHCIIVYAHGKWQIEDLGSTNGIYLGYLKIKQPHSLSDGDIIGIGNPEVLAFRFLTSKPENDSCIFTLPSSSSLLIGRQLDNNIAIPFDKSISNKHARLFRSSSGWMLQDIGSSNGTWINGSKINKRELSQGDIVTVGNTNLKFEERHDDTINVVIQNPISTLSLKAINLDLVVGSRVKKSILKQVCLDIRGGEFVGILGPSGAGKTTLLTTLNGYNRPTSGHVLLNASNLYGSYDMYRNIIGYVPQDDVVYSELTVYQSLYYVTKLRLPSDLSEDERSERIKKTIADLNLEHVRNERITSLSGGQRKRVSVAAELITQPRILYMDEPTSGLDPSTEERLMIHLKSLAKHSKTTILITTHILYNLQLLDKIIIMARGNLCYYGSPDQILDYFSMLAGYQITRPTQIFDYLEGRSVNQTSELPSQHLVQIADKAAIEFKHTELYQDNIEKPISHVMPSIIDNKPVRNVKKPRSIPKWAIFSPAAIFILARRHLTIKTSNSKNFFVYLLVPLVLGMVTLSMSAPEPLSADQAAQNRLEISKQVGSSGVTIGNVLSSVFTERSSQNVDAVSMLYSIKYANIINLPIPLSVLLMYVMMASFTGTLMACMELSSERELFRREYMAGLNINDYLLSKLPFLFGLTAIQVTIFLLICAFRPELSEVNVLMVFAVLIAVSWAACVIGLLVSALDPTRGQLSVVLAVVVVLPQLVLSGALGPDFYAGMDVFMKRIADLLPSRWGFEMLLTASFDHPDRSHYNWIGDLIKNQMGFEFGRQVYYKGLLYLLVQSFAVLSLTRWLIVRRFKM